MKTMTKKTWMMLASVVMVLALTASLVACGGKKEDGNTTGANTTTQEPGTAGNEEATEEKDEESEITEEGEHLPEDGEDLEGGFPEGDKELSQILTQMYGKVPAVQEIALGDPMPIDLTGEDFSYWLGITDASGIDAAIYSEPMMSSVAYSVCLVRAKDGTDIEQLKKDIFDKVNAVKWLCVTAEKVLVTNSDNTILLVMTNADVTAEMYNAFSEVMGGKLGEKLERDGE